ncbi:virion structural protein [Rhizobium phage RHph_Y38]|uniref:Tail protein n=2 Tax=Acanvirus TaxID=3044653 RepID=A0AAE7VN01_9CAUD|nr:virion structural protein [Rhizobium phage RHph_Y38]YP_010658300.1 virion structural protein [Rhizobium phage RHEph22]QIG67792.1 putative tail protein [Rhizobium phage RHph_Y38]QXV74762.1 putative tail protein [Rhizobium phage RHEph22]QXV74858.1 putative tail protein [Rhizobium phage RHEph24]
MNLGELFTKLSHTHLSNLAIGSDGAGTVPTDKRAQLISHINESLLRIFTRFVLYEKSLILETTSSRVNYPLEARYAQSSGSDEAHKYIMDLNPSERFTGDVLKILEVYNNFGARFVLNDVEDFWSLFTPQPNVLQVPHPQNGQAFAVQYQARHPIIAPNATNDFPLLVPAYLEGALTSCVGAAVIGSMNGQDNLLKQQSLMAEYEGICLDIESKDLPNLTVSTTNTKFAKRGFR